MRHRVYGKHLGRNKDERTTLFKGLVQSLIVSEAIETTESKAKAIKGLIDKIITQSKNKDTRRLVTQYLVQKTTQDKLFKDLLPRMNDRTSGYTSVVKLGRRLGDGAMMVQISLLLSQAKVAQKSDQKAEDKKTEKVSKAPADLVEAAVEVKAVSEKKEVKAPKKAAPKKAVKKS